MSDALIGRVLDGTYRIVRPLARGGMGAIYVAEHARLAGKRYAIKMLHPAFATDENVFMRFRREAEIASQLGHEHIVEVHDFNVTAERVPYMVMEYLDGEDLAARITRGPLRLAEVVRLVAQVASALAAAHAAGIVHRDLKPQNIFLCRRGGGDFVKVLDFGISKVRDSSSLITATQSVMGTPFYMSPEQAMGRVRDVDARTDVFALGAIVWEMLTGEMAFASDTIPGALYKVVHVQPRPVHELRSELPPAVTDVLARAMAKDREQRTPSVQELAAQLARTTVASMAAGHAATRLPSTPNAHERPRARNTPTTMSSSVGQVASTHPPMSSIPAPARRRVPLVIALGAIVVATGVVVGVARRTDRARSAAPIDAIAKTTTPDAPPPPPPPAPPPAVTLRFDVKPADAVVQLDGESIEGFEVVHARGDTAVHVKITATDHASWEGTVTPDQDRIVAIDLAPATKSRRSRRADKPPASRLPAPKPAYGTATHVEPAPMLPPRVELPPPPPPQPTSPPHKKSGTIFDD